MSSRPIFTEARIFESRSTTCASSRSLLLASSFSVAITCATELFNSGTRSRMSRIVFCSMSSGFSVDSIIPPNRALTEREILLNSPMMSLILYQEMCDLPWLLNSRAHICTLNGCEGFKIRRERETEYNSCCGIPSRRPWRSLLEALTFGPRRLAQGYGYGELDVPRLGQVA